MGEAQKKYSDDENISPEVDQWIIEFCDRHAGYSPDRVLKIIENDPKRKLLQAIAMEQVNGGVIKSELLSAKLSDYFGAKFREVLDQNAEDPEHPLGDIPTPDDLIWCMGNNNSVYPKVQAEKIKQIVKLIDETIFTIAKKEGYEISQYELATLEEVFDGMIQKVLANHKDEKLSPEKMIDLLEKEMNQNPHMILREVIEKGRNGK